MGGGGWGCQFVRPIDRSIGVGIHICIDQIAVFMIMISATMTIQSITISSAIVIASSRHRPGMIHVHPVITRTSLTLPPLAAHLDRALGTLSWVSTGTPVKFLFRGVVGDDHDIDDVRAL